MIDNTTWAYTWEDVATYGPRVKSLTEDLTLQSYEYTSDGRLTGYKQGNKTLQTTKYDSQKRILAQVFFVLYPLAAELWGILIKSDKCSPRRHARMRSSLLLCVAACSAAFQLSPHAASAPQNAQRHAAIRCGPRVKIYSVGKEGRDEPRITDDNKRVHKRCAGAHSRSSVYGCATMRRCSLLCANQRTRAKRQSCLTSEGRRTSRRNLLIGSTMASRPVAAGSPSLLAAPTAFRRN